MSAVDAAPRVVGPPVRVVLDARFACARYDGVGRYVAGLLGALIEVDGLDLSAVLPPEGTAVRHPLPPASSRLRTLAPGRAGRPESPWSFLEMPRLARRGGVWHMPFPASTPLLPGALVVTHHDCLAQRHPEIFQRRSRWALLAASWAALRRARLVMVDSQQTADDTVRFYRLPADRLRVVPLGVDPAPASEPARESAVRRRLGLDGGFVLGVGRPRRHKGYRLLVEALSRLPAAGRPELVIVGRPDPEQSDGHEALAADLGVGVRRLWDLDERELLAVYRGAALVALPSTVEGFGLPLLEALAAGAPVLASDIEPFRSTGGAAGAVRYLPLTVAAWTAALETGIDDRAWRQAAVELGPRRAAEFPWSSCARRAAAVYREAAA